MTPDHCAIHCDRGHFCSILVSNIFCDPLFLLNGLIGLLSSRHFQNRKFFQHTRISIRVSYADFSLLPIFSDLLPYLAKSPKLTFSSDRTSFTVSL